MKRKILIAINIIIILISLKLLYNIAMNTILINKYNNGEYSTSIGQAMTKLNFPQSYIANYNYGNILYQNGEYEEAIEEYKKALDVNIPEKKECKVRINYALAICKTVELDEESQDSILNAIKTYESAIGVLTEKGCANNEDTMGHSADAEQLRKDIQKEIVSINAYGNYVYFIGIESKAYNEEDEVDNKIYRMKADGSSDLEILNDNEFNNDCYEIYLINGYIYYIDENANIARMNLDGSNKSTVVENGTGYLGITEKYIIFNKPKEDNAEEYETYIMDVDGGNPRPILEGKRLYSVNIEDGYVYYSNDDKKIYRTKIDSNQEELVYDTEAYNLNVYNGYAYYLNYKDSANEDYTVCIYKVTLDPTYDGKKAELETYSSYLDIVDNWALYMDSNETNGYINLLSTDGTNDEVQLYLLDYEKYYERIDTTTTEDGPTEGEPAEEYNNITQ